MVTWLRVEAPSTGMRTRTFDYEDLIPQELREVIGADIVSARDGSRSVAYANFSCYPCGVDLIAFGPLESRRPNVDEILSAWEDHDWHGGRHRLLL